MSVQKFHRAAFAIALAGAAFTTWAQPEPAVTMPAEKVDPKPVPAEAPAAVKGVAVPAGGYKCGGVSSDESTAMRAQMKSHPLSLLFARTGGAYVADVDVTISGAKSLSFKSNGPVCLVDVPPGTYTVQAVAEGISKSQSVTVGGGSKTVDFRF